MSIANKMTSNSVVKYLVCTSLGRRKLLVCFFRILLTIHMLAERRLPHGPLDLQDTFELTQLIRDATVQGVKQSFCLNLDGPDVGEARQGFAQGRPWNRIGVHVFIHVCLVIRDPQSE